MSLPPPIIPLDEVTLIDRAAEDHGADIATLMERAGRALAEEVIHRLSGDDTVLVAVGPGNNGGDGWCCARVLAERGCNVTVYQAHEPRSDPCRA
ncbi:MAG: NAD(P)H-hydrate epimerase, partial [Planctomycetota bacterium]